MPWSNDFVYVTKTMTRRAQRRNYDETFHLFTVLCPSSKTQRRDMRCRVNQIEATDDLSPDVTNIRKRMLIAAGCTDKALDRRKREQQ